MPGLFDDFTMPGVQYAAPSQPTPGSAINFGPVSAAPLPTDTPGAWAGINGALHNPALNSLLGGGAQQQLPQAQPQQQHPMMNLGLMPGAWQFRLPDMTAFGFLPHGPSQGLPR